MRITPPTVIYFEKPAESAKALLNATVLCKTSATVVESLTPLPTSAFAKSAKVTESLGALLYDSVR